VIADRSLLSSTAFIEVQFSPLSCALSSNRAARAGSTAFGPGDPGMIETQSLRSLTL